MLVNDSSGDGMTKQEELADHIQNIFPVLKKLVMATPEIPVKEALAVAIQSKGEYSILYHDFYEIMSEFEVMNEQNPSKDLEFMIEAFDQLKSKTDATLLRIIVVAENGSSYCGRVQVWNNPVC